MLLSDRDIFQAIEHGDITIRPYDRHLVQPASIDVRLAADVRSFDRSAASLIDVKNIPEDYTVLNEVSHSHPYILHPGEFVLCSTVEHFGLADNLVGRVEGKSSLGRLGLMIHSTAGFIDPGWDGVITLELSNIGPLPITLYRDMPIGQISFMQTLSPALRPYGHPDLGSRYYGQDRTTPSRYTLRDGQS